VLDDYHEVAPDAPLHAVIATLVGVLPRTARLIILSRETPPAPLARAQTYDQVARLGAEDLRLTLGEGVAIAQARGIEGDADEKSIQMLLERSDGWAAGFVLLLRHPVNDLPSPETTEVLFEYFAQEVLRGAGEEVRTFLLRTAWLPSMTAEMARRMAGQPQVEALLRSLVQGNYFLSRSDAPIALYRYHQLFRQFLLHHTGSAWSKNELDQCRRQAAAILEEASQLDAAAALWCEAGDWDSLTGLIRRVGPSLLAQARTQSLDEWLAGIPDEAVGERPWLLYWSGRSQLHRDPIAARHRFEQAYVSFKAAQDVERVFLSWASVCETYWFAFDGTDPLKQWLAELDEVQAQWPRFPSPEIETQVAFGAFYALIANDPRHPLRGRWENTLLSALDSNQPPDLRLMIANLLMFHYVWTIGDQGRSALVLERLRRLTGDDATAPLCVIIARTWGDFAYECCFGGSAERCQRVRGRSDDSGRAGHSHL
jgi:LuxR family maltose regulon positive regulatory protein